MLDQKQTSGLIRRGVVGAAKIPIAAHKVFVGASGDMAHYTTVQGAVAGLLADELGFGVPSTSNYVVIEVLDSINHIEPLTAPFSIPSGVIVLMNGGVFLIPDSTVFPSPPIGLGAGSGLVKPIVVFAGGASFPTSVFSLIGNTQMGTFVEGGALSVVVGATSWLDGVPIFYTSGTGVCELFDVALDSANNFAVQHLCDRLNIHRCSLTSGKVRMDSSGGALGIFGSSLQALEMGSGVTVMPKIECLDTTIRTLIMDNASYPVIGRQLRFNGCGIGEIIASLDNPSSIFEDFFHDGVLARWTPTAATHGGGDGIIYARGGIHYSLNHTSIQDVNIGDAAQVGSIFRVSDVETNAGWFLSIEGGTTVEFLGEACTGTITPLKRGQSITIQKVASQKFVVLESHGSFELT